ncbi:MAG: pyruvate, phosphate dikinase [Thermoanaerobaculaceae bacterium]|nr:pyruvate, phosphate dikinase [Thermoanaerobaculaceae bacterium]
MNKWVYFFGEGKAEGNGKMKELLGGKGAGLAEMTNLGIPVPPGFTITTEVCTYFYQNNKTYPKDLEEQLKKALLKVEKIMGRKFGDPSNPLLFSVRSGARASMPGMMDTILNLGLNDKCVEGLAKVTGNPRFAYDSYRRFVAMYGDVVLGLKPQSKKEDDPFEVIIEEMKKKKGVKFDTELKTEDLKELVSLYKAEIKKKLGVDFPEDPYEQLWGAIGAVFGSWMNERAIAYRQLYNIPSDWGTAVNVQTMVFGNKGDNSGTGVGFTRDPALGENRLYGEFLINAQGEDVVAGIRTPQPIEKLGEVMPEVYKQLVEIRNKLESHFKDMQDFEFTIEDGKLWMLQTRTGKRHPFAAAKMAVDMFNEGLIDEKEALSRPEADGIAAFLAPVFDSKAKEEATRSGKILAKGLPAGPGGASGKIVFNAVDAENWAKKGEKVLLVRKFTSPEDIKGMNAAQGILTAQGGMTSHAALVARQMGKVCIVGCSALDIDYEKGELQVKGKIFKEGDFLSIDGFTGEVIEGELPTKPSETLQVLNGEIKPDNAENYKRFAKLMEWADKYRKMEVWTNADTPKQAQTAVMLGAQGIGLCRTEHMFFEGERIHYVRRMILSESEKERKEALYYLFPMQKEDFIGIFKAMDGRPVTIRLLDPPLHEFLPSKEALAPEVFEEKVSAIAKELKVDSEEIIKRIESLHENNPMLGHRGCRLGVTFPEIYEMQIKAIIEAAVSVAKEGRKVKPEVMIPIVATEAEMKIFAEMTRKIAEEVFEKEGKKVDYLVGTMIELPRACVAADKIAKYAEFFSFGTNDLTQTTCGISRDDVKGFLGAYLDREIFPADPFQKIDREGVGELMKMAVSKGRASRKDLQIGICGEHGGEPSSVEFCYQIGLNYVSCSPYRVPVARLAAAQAALKK